MVDFRYRVNKGAWIVIENATLPYNVGTIAGDDVVDIQPIGSSLFEYGTDVTAPTITSPNPSGSYPENSPVGGTLTANETVMWGKTGPDQALVSINISTGVWSIAPPDFEVKNSYSWTFTATDLSSNVTNQVVSISITDVPDATTVLTVLPNGDIVVESLGSPWDIVVMRQGDGEISVSGGSGAAKFQYSIDGGVTWVEATSPSTINETGEVIIEALGDAVLSDPIVLYDTFTGTAGTLAGRVSETGGTWNGHALSSANHSLSGTGSIYQTGTSISWMTNTVVMPTADYEVEAEMVLKSVLSGNSISINGRMETGNLTFYSLRFATNEFLLLKCINGTFTTLATTPYVATVDAVVNVRLRLLGNQISGFVNDSLVLGPIADNSITAAGRIGTRIYGANSTPTTGLHYNSIIGRTL